SDSKLPDEAIAPATSPAQIVVTEPTVEAADHVTIVSPNAAQGSSVEAIEPSDATQVAEHATRSDSKLPDEAIALAASPAQIVVPEPTVEAADHVTIVSPNAAQESSVDAIEPSDSSHVRRPADRSDSKLPDEAIAPATSPAQIVVTQQTVEELS